MDTCMLILIKIFVNETLLYLLVLHAAQITFESVGFLNTSTLMNSVVIMLCFHFFFQK